MIALLAEYFGAEADGQLAGRVLCCPIWPLIFGTTNQARSTSAFLPSSTLPRETVCSGFRRLSVRVRIGH
jgi:hypothetical protein